MNPTTLQPSRARSSTARHTPAAVEAPPTAPAPSAHFLRRALALDSTGSLATGVIQIAATTWMSALTGLAAGLLLATGWFLLAFGALAAWTASRSRPPVAIAWLFVAGNVAWALLSAGLWAWGDGHTVWGQVFIALNVAFVLLMAGLEWTGLRRLG